MKANKTLIIRVGENGSWFATQNGKHLTAQQTYNLIAKGVAYKFE